MPVLRIPHSASRRCPMSRDLSLRLGANPEIAISTFRNLGVTEERAAKYFHVEIPTLRSLCRETVDCSCLVALLTSTSLSRERSHLRRNT